MGTRVNRLLNPPPGHEEVQISSKIPVAIRDEIKANLGPLGITMQEFFASAVLDAADELRLKAASTAPPAKPDHSLLESAGIKLDDDECPSTPAAPPAPAAAPPAPAAQSTTDVEGPPPK